MVKGEKRREERKRILLLLIIILLIITKEALGEIIKDAIKRCTLSTSLKDL